MKSIIIFFIFFTKAKGYCFASFPNDVLDLEYASLITKEVKNVAFLLSPPCSLSVGVLKHKSFGIIFDGRKFIDFQIDKKILPLYLGAKLGWGKGKIFRFSNGAVFSPIPDFSLGINYIFSYLLKEKDYFFNFQCGVNGKINFFRIYFETSGNEALRDFGFHIGTEFFFPYIDSLKIFSGVLVVKEKFYLTSGIKYSIMPFDFYFSYSKNRLFLGISIDYREKIRIKKITEKVEVVKEVPVYIKEKPKEEKKVIKEEEKPKKELTEEELKNLEFHYKKGIEYYKKDMLEEAIREWEKVFEIYPDYKDVRKYLEETKEKLKKLKEIE